MLVPDVALASLWANELSMMEAGVQKLTGVAAVRVANAKARMVAAKRANMVKILESKVD